VMLIAAGINEKVLVTEIFLAALARALEPVAAP